ncbi:restriction endonuclease [Edaphocola aurantiacus]|uniref:restriction endonuclease n=1 Tax=Edaphocola aurantiacus TaxID=2601682 RepID=UPI001C97DAEB|nr:hypothetical protein [Edaphocola aurantiacus]
MGPLNPQEDIHKLKDKFKTTYPEDSRGRVNQCVGQLSKFLYDFKIGDTVVTYDSSTREYYTGKIISEYHFDPTKEYHHYRKVEWNDGAIPRDPLSTEAKNSLGSISTVFEIAAPVGKELIEKTM